jgi:small subunit ribosomal protein S8
MVMISDPVGDLLVRIKNGYLAKKLEVTMPYSSFKQAVAEVLHSFEFVDDIKVKEQDGKKVITIYLRYADSGQPALTDLKQVSKPGRRVYRPYKNLKQVRGGYGILLVSTPEGIMVGEEARKRKIGGEVLAEVW